MSSRCSAGALIGDTVTEINNYTIRSNFGFWGEGKVAFLEKTSWCRVESQETQWGGEASETQWRGECSDTTAPSLHPPGAFEFELFLGL